MNYFYASPGRWTNCYLHEARVLQGITTLCECVAEAVGDLGVRS